MFNVAVKEPNYRLTDWPSPFAREFHSRYRRAGGLAGGDNASASFHSIPKKWTNLRARRRRARGIAPGGAERRPGVNLKPTTPSTPAGDRLRRAKRPNSIKENFILVMRNGSK